jgi:hypothetical protein
MKWFFSLKILILLTLNPDALGVLTTRPLPPPPGTSLRPCDY